MSLLCLGLLALAASPPTDVRFVDGLVAQAFSAQADVDVLTRSDLRQALDVEADKQTLGCATDASCLAEIAAAMDARLVVIPTVDVLAGEYLLQISVFDAKEAKSIARDSGRAATPTELSRLVEQKGAALAAATRARLTGPLRVLVLDAEARVVETAPVAAAPLPWLWIGAAGLAVTGATGIGLGALADSTSVAVHEATSNDLKLDGAAAKARYDESDGWAAGAVAGYAVGALALAGAGVVAVLAARE